MQLTGTQSFWDQTGLVPLEPISYNPKRLSTMSQCFQNRTEPTSSTGNRSRFGPNILKKPFDRSSRSERSKTDQNRLKSIESIFEIFYFLFFKS